MNKFYHRDCLNSARYLRVRARRMMEQATIERDPETAIRLIKRSTGMAIKAFEFEDRAKKGMLV